MAKIDELFRYLISNKGSDLHLAAGMPPRIRAQGQLNDVPDWPVLEDGALRDLLREITNDKQWADYQSNDLDFAYGLPGEARFRCNYLQQHFGHAAVFRVIPDRIKTLDELRCPPVIGTLAHVRQGLVLVTGPTGSGKSTTLAAIIDAINTQYSRHIVTIEDPVEFVHQNKKSVLSQREVGSDTGSFAAALRAAMRQDADVVLVGEMRDLETISLAITAAEMGVLVFGTLHTNSAAKTIDRIIDVFPPAQQSQVRTTLSESVAAICAQLLLRTPDGAGRVACQEVLLRTSGLPNLIREGNTPQIASLIAQGKSQGMQTMDDALFLAASEGRADPADAFMKSSDKKRFARFAPSEGAAVAGH